MKHLIFAAAVALTLTTANAQDCKSLGDIAEKVMEARQAGVPLSNIMSSADFSELTKRIAIDAYKTPRYASEDLQQWVVTDFRSDWEVACYEMRSKKKGTGNV